MKNIYMDHQYENVGGDGMKSLRWILLMAVVLSLLSFSGCLTKSYFFDFTMEQDLERADGDWVEHTEGEFELSSDGLEMWNNLVSAPLGFKGDIVLTVRFELNVSSDSIANLEILLAADIDDNDPCMGIDIYGLGSEDEYFSVFKYGVSLYGHMSPIPVLHRSGINEFKLIKTGNLLEFRLNGAILMDEVPIVDYGFDIFSPHIYCWQVHDSDALYIRSVRVNYEDTAVLL